MRSSSASVTMSGTSAAPWSNMLVVSRVMVSLPLRKRMPAPAHGSASGAGSRTMTVPGMSARQAVMRGAHRPPVEAAQAAPDRRDGDGADTVAGEGRDEAAKPGLDVADRAAVAPVALGGEVDDSPGSVAAGVEHEHAARPQPALGAGAAVGLEGVGVAAPELEGEAGARDADAVDGIDDGLGGLGEEGRRV